MVQAFDMNHYRLIMSRKKVDYTRRPKGFCNTESSISSFLMSQINSDLEKDGVSKFSLVAIVTDSKNER